MKITVLGTASAIPTKTRNHCAFFLDFDGNYILFDCGEGTQRQMTIARLSVPSIDKILITHWHGDHVLGLPGVIQTCSMAKRDKPLEVYGPGGSSARYEHIKKAFNLEVNYPFNVKEVESGIVCDKDKYEISVLRIKHGDIPSVSYCFKEKDRLRINMEYMKKFGLTKHVLLGNLQKGKDITYEGKKIKAKDATVKVPGKKIIYLGDGRPDAKFRDFLKDADLFITEATYLESMKEDAIKNSHVTVKDVAELAEKSGVKKIVLTHFSKKIRDMKDVSDEAKKYFKGEVIVAKDFMEIKV